MTAVPEADRTPTDLEPSSGGEGPPRPGRSSLAIEGMTCAACAVRIEKKLNRLDEVRATVNYATATARVTAPAAMPVAELVAAVERAGYTARPPRLRRAARGIVRSGGPDQLAAPDEQTTRPNGTLPTCGAG